MRPYRFEVIEMANSDGFARVHVDDMRASFDRYNSELRKMHRRLWEKRKEALVLRLHREKERATDNLVTLLNNYEFQEAEQVRAVRNRMTDRYCRVLDMEYKP